MTTITREQQKQILIDTANHVISRDNTSPYSENLRELARIALASLTAEPVLYAAEETLAYSNMGEIHLTCLSEPMGDAVIPLYTAPPVPVVPEEITADGIIGMHECGFVEGWNACRAAMLQGSQPVSNHDELPYSQVKAVADLYALCWQSGEVVTYTPDPEKATIWLNNYSGTCVQEYVKLERLQEALSGNSPVIPDGWISCSERMPEDEQEVIVHNKLGYRYVSYFDEHSGLFFDMRGGNQMNCIEHILVTHWMPLPAAPEPEQS
ncbi:DUF551 domain-containing protein [Salmonella enterica subsp. enterica serovar Typhimurium]|nr:DUF551 domain-containing protein [Salmonella enterica subsp. enterica serovar Typhimurium]